MQASATFGRRLLRVSLLLVPVAYVGQLLATAAHEFLGHGIAALMVGGRFTGLSLAWDGMGSAIALAPADASLGAQVTILVAGVVSTCSMGLALLVAATRIRNGPVRWILLVLSASAFLEGGPYTFWNAWQVEGHGDIGRILRLLEATPDGHEDGWRTVFLVAGGVITVVGTVLPLGRLLLDVEASFPRDIDLTAKRRSMVALLFGGAGVAAWWLFDWEQLVPGVGMLPPLTGGALMAGTAVWFALRPTNPARPAEPVGISAGLIASCWGMALASLAGTLLWLGHGIRWAG